MSTRARTMGRAIILAASFTLTAGAAAAATAYHAAQSPAEQALQRILKADERPPESVDPTGGSAGHRPRTVPPPGAPYLKYLTMPLATAILVSEAAQVRANCGGVYKSEEVCGMDSDPIVCAQDFPDHYLFRTTESGPSFVVIEAAWPPDQSGAQPSPSGAYRLILGGGVWKIDGIACAGGGDSFNWRKR